MPKNILIISSTPRKNGNSAVLCGEFAKGATDAGHNATMLNLREKNIHCCTGCGACYEKGLSCPFNDDMTEIIEKMKAADVIVLATPVYFYSMCGQLKIMIDRTVPVYTELKDKSFYFILTAGDDDINNMKSTVAALNGFCDCLDNASVDGIIYGLGVHKTGEILSNKAMSEAYQAGMAL